MDRISREVMEHAAREVLKTSAGVEIVTVEPAAEPADPVLGLIATLSLNGARGGTLLISCGRPEAGRLAAGMLGGAEPDEDTVRDALGELANQIGGTIKRKLTASGRGITLSVPVVVAGSLLAHRVKSKADPLAVDVQLGDGRVHLCLWPTMPESNGAGSARG